MHKCFKCGTEFEGNFCPECGTKRQEEKTCPQCGAALAESAKFCTECGYSFLAVMPEAPTAPPAPAPQKTEKAAAPATAEPKPAREPVFTPAVLQKIHGVLRYVPAALLGLFAVLAFAFLAAPFIKADIFLMSATENAYEALSDTSINFLHGSVVAVLIIASLALPVAALMCYLAHTNNSLKINRADFAAAPFYLAILITACTIIGLINAEDGGAGVLSAESCPTLLIVFSVLFALLSAGATAGRYFIAKSPAFDEAREELKKRRAAQTPPVPPEAVARPLPPRRNAEPKVIKRANRFTSRKPTPYLICFMFLFLGAYFAKMIYRELNSGGSGNSLFELTVFFVTIGFIIVYCFAAIIASQVLLTRFKHVTTWNKRERSAKSYLIIAIVNAVVVAAMLIYTMVLYFTPQNYDETYNYNYAYAFFSREFLPLLILSALLLIPLWVSLANMRRGKKVNTEIYGKKKPLPDDSELVEFKELNREYLTYRKEQAEYEEFRIAEEIYRYEDKRYRRGELCDSRPPKFLFSLWIHKIAVAVTALVLAVLIAVPCIVFPIITNMFRIDVVKQFELGADTHTVRNILPEADNRTDSAWEFYDDSYMAIVHKLEENNKKTDTVTDLEELGKIMEENIQLTEQLNKLTYRYICISFAELSENSGTRVVRTMLDLNRCDSAKSTLKEVSSVRLSPNEAAVISADTKIEELLQRFTAEIYYKDGSFQNCFVPASAFSSVDFFTKGTYKISWQDSWGEYTADFTIR